MGAMEGEYISVSLACTVMLQHEATLPKPFHDAVWIEFGKAHRGQVGGDDDSPAVGMPLEDNLLQRAADKICMVPLRAQIVQHQQGHAV